MRFLCVLGISIAIAGLGRTQDTGRAPVEIRGHITGGGLSSYSELTVQLRAGSSIVESASVFSSGDFALQGVPQGNYIASVLDWQGEVLWQDSLSVVGGFGPGLTIRLPDRQRRQQPPSGTVSVQALAHEVPKAAMKEYRAGQAAFEQAEYEKAAAHFEEALSKDPQFVDAYNNLAATYSRLGRHAEALDQLRNAVKVDPNSPIVNLNLGAGLLRAGQFAEAEAASRRALELNPDLPQADVITGICIKALNGDSGEALFYLLRGAAKYPEARLTAAEIFESTGKRSEALEQLKKYLETSSDPHRRRQVEQWMAKLQ